MEVRLRAPRRVPRADRATLRREPVGHRDGLDQGRLAAAVLPDQHGHARREVEPVAQEVGHRRDRPRPAGVVGDVRARGHAAYGPAVPPRVRHEREPRTTHRHLAVVRAREASDEAYGEQGDVVLELPTSMSSRMASTSRAAERSCVRSADRARRSRPSSMSSPRRSTRPSVKNRSVDPDADLRLALGAQEVRRQADERRDLGLQPADVPGVVDEQRWRVPGVGPADATALDQGHDEGGERVDPEGLERPVQLLDGRGGRAVARRAGGRAGRSGAGPCRRRPSCRARRRRRSPGRWPRPPSPRASYQSPPTCSRAAAGR